MNDELRTASLNSSFITHHSSLSYYVRRVQRDIPRDAGASAPAADVQAGRRGARAVGAVRRVHGQDKGHQPRAAAAQGARRNLRPRDASEARLHRRREGLFLVSGWPFKERAAALTE